MLVYNRLARFAGVIALLLALTPPLPAKSRKGDKLLEDGRQAELRKEWDKALDLFEQALKSDPNNSFYDIAVRKARFQTGEFHVGVGRKLRDDGKLDEALAEFMKAYAVDPSSAIAQQEIRRTNDMIERERRKKEGGNAAVDTRTLTPTELARKDMEDRIASVLPVPELKPISPQITSLKMNNQPVKVLFETVGKLAGINVIFDSDYQASPRNFNIDLTNVTLEDALDQVGVLTKSFWKPLSPNTIFVAQDNPTKRRDYEDNVVKVFYLSNVVKPQDLQEILTAVRTISDIRRIFPMQALNAILVRGTNDQVALAEKLINDIDKPRSEVVVDIVVMEANVAKTRTLAASIISGGSAGLNLPISFNPRASVGAIGSTPAAVGTTPAATTTSSLIPLGSLRKLTENDWALSIPNGLLQAVMTDRTTRVLQSPQVRAVDGEKASLRIGDRYPYATGSFQPGVGAVGVSPLVSTQFQFADVGVNVDLTPRIHGADEVTLHCELEISSIKDTINLGGLSQPIIGQRKLAVDIRVKDGQATIVGGLMQMQDSNSIAGTPGVGNIPILKRLFSSQDLQKSRGELLIALVPHIIRSPEITSLNTRGVAAGNDQQVKLNFAPKKQDLANPPAAPAAKPAADAGAPVASPAPEAAKPQALPALPNLAFLPVAAQVPMGQPVLVTLQLNNANDAFGASLRLKFDPKLVKVADVKQGTFLSSDSARVSFSENTLNDTGEAIIRVDRFPGSGGISGSGPLLTFTLTPQTPGTANVTVSDLLVRNAQLQPIAVAAPALAITIK